MDVTAHLCSKCLAPVEGRDRDGDANWSCSHQWDLDAVLLEVEAHVDPYEAYSAQRVYIEAEWRPLIEKCEAKRAAQRRGELAYLYRDDGLRWNEADRQARWARIAESKKAAMDTVMFSSIMKDKFIGPIRDSLNRQAYGLSSLIANDTNEFHPAPSTPQSLDAMGFSIPVKTDDSLPPGTIYAIAPGTVEQKVWDDHDTHVQAHSDFWRQVARPEYREPPRAGKAIEALMERDTIRPEKARAILEGLV